MNMSPKIAIAALLVAAAATSSPAFADGKNEVRAVTFDEDGGITRVHVRGAQTPTFTVYKLDRPTRVVIDLPQARLADGLRGHESAAVFTPSTWAVSTISAQQLDDGAVRVSIALARPGRYDVKTDGNEVIIMVMPRDPAPRTGNPAELARMQAENEQARKQAQEASASAQQSRAEADTAKATAAGAQAEAERLRKTATEQAARAETAQRAVEDARKLQQKNAATVDDLKRAQQVAVAAKTEAEAAKSAASRAQGDADRMRVMAEKVRRDALAEAAHAKADVLKARDEMVRSQAAAEQTIAKTRAEAEAVRTDAANQRAEADQATRDAAKARAEADQATRDAGKARADADKTMSAAQQQRAEADKAMSAAQQQRAEAETAKTEAARTAEQMRRDSDELKRDAARKRAEAEAAKLEVAKAKDDVARTRAEATRARSEADAAKAEAAHAKTDAEAARAEAEAARIAAAAEKKQAESDRRTAETSRQQAESMLRDAKQQVASLDKKTQAAQELEDKARTAHAAAQAREEAAREAAAQAMRDRQLAEASAKRAQDARDRSTNQAAAERSKLVAGAQAAERRLADARTATEAAELQRKAAETAAAMAKHDLEQTRSTLATVEQQRSSAESAASDAARKRSEAEAAANDAARRRTDAEVAAADAAKKRTEAEHAAGDAAQRKTVAERQRAEAEAMKIAAIEATRAAQAAKAAADKQRAVSETATQTAMSAKHDAEASLSELTTRRQAAERAAADVEARAKAEAKAQAELAAARARKASDDELRQARAEANRLASDRERAETELGDRRKAVAQQQAETSKLETAAAQARDAAGREESRRAKLAMQREQEEQELARIKQQKLALTTPAQVRGQATTPTIAVQRSAPIAAMASEPPTTSAGGDKSAPNDVVTKPAPIVAAAKAAPTKLAKVSNVTYKGQEGSGQVDLAITGDATVQLGEVTGSHVELIIDHAELGAKLERTLDVSKLGSPVRTVSSYRDRRTANRVRLVAELAQPATPTVVQNAGSIHVRFVTNEVAKRAPHTQNVPSPVVGGFGAASTPIAQQSVTQVPPQGGRARIYHGATVDFDFKDAPIHDLLRIIADTGHISVVVPDTIEAKVTVRLKRVPWDQALDVILASHGLWYRREGNIYRIAPRKELDAEDEAENARREAAKKAESPKPEVITLNYASASELKTKLENMKSPKGTIEVDDRTNSLIIDDVAGNREQISKLAYQLDTQTPQISIEARIVEARSTFVRQFGVQWGGNALAGATGGNATGLIFPSSIGIAGGNEDAQTNRNGITATPSDFAVNMPASTGSGEGGALGLSLGSVGGNFNINLRLSALEDSGSVRIISAPKITVLNNKEARIAQGVSIPISVVSAAGTSTQFVQADLSLTVTPYVSQRDCAIAMNLVVTKNEPDFVNVGARGDPTILRKEARTQMLVNDGETSVLGGIYTRNTGLAYKKVPFFGDLPLLGWLFKNRRENDDRTEILVFITPKITNKASLRCQ